MNASRRINQRTDQVQLLSGVMVTVPEVTP